MTKDQKKRINEVWDEVNEEFHDKSTEFILEMVAERCRIMGIKPDCDCCDVAEAL